jgi:hypothetical protein
MNNYFSVEKWIRNEKEEEIYYPSSCCSKEFNRDLNSLVSIKEDWNKDFKIGERIVPGFELLHSLTLSCVNLMKASYGEDEASTEISYEAIFGFYEKLGDNDNEIFISWFFTDKDDKGNIPYKSDITNYQKFKEKHIGKKLSYYTIEDTIKDALENWSQDIVIRVVDIVYDFINDCKVYILDITHRLWEIKNKG